jgi:acyl transferase domain-containing protein/SAM-dependent methyltransferase
MMAVGCGETELQELLHQVKAGKAVIGCKNSPSSFTVSGDHDAIIELQELLNTRNLFNRVLKVDVAYHSPHMELVADQYKDSLGSITTASSNVKFYSSTSGGLLERPSLDGEFWSNHMTGPVLFSDALHALCSFSETVDGQRRGIEILIEIGPHSALKGPIEQTLKGASLSGNIVYVPSLVRGKDAIQTTQDLAAGILMKGYPLNITCVNLEGDANQLNQISVLANLPPYPWMHLENYWHESRISKSYRTRSNPHNDLLGSPAADFNPLEPRWRNILRLNDVPWLRDHRLLSETVFPMAGYISMAIEAALQHANVDGEEREISSIKLQQVSAKNRLILSENTGHEILLSLRPYRLGPEDQSKQWNEFVIFSCSEETGFLEHCRGLVSVQLKIKYSDQACANLTEGSEGVICSHDRNAIFGHSMEYSKLYKELKLIGVQYGPIFQGLANIQSSGYSGRARVAFPNTVKSMPLEHESTYVIHPALLDTCLQLVFPLLTTRQTGLKRLYMPTFIEEIEISCPMDQTAGHQLDLQGMLTKDSVDTPVFSISARELDTQSAKELISIKGLRLIGLSTQTSTSNEIIDPYSKLKWMPFLDMLTPSQYRSLFSSSRTIELEERSLIRLLNRVSRYYLRNALKRISEEGGYSGTRHANLYKWIQDQVGGCSRSDSPSLGQESISNDIDEQVPEYVQQAESSGPVGQFLCRIGENLPSIIREEVEPLSLMLVDNLLERYYEELLPLKSRLYPAAASFATYLSHQLPNLRILEIGAGTGGATLPILEALSRSTNSSPPFGCYDFTDISAGFFEKAKKKLATWQDDINFRKLDIETKPSSQGFIEESYDLIIAANVLHATVNMEKTMKNVRTLLKPGGKLLLLEITSPTVTVFPFATLPGWWLGEYFMIPSRYLFILILS